MVLIKGEKTRKELIRFSEDVSPWFPVSSAQTTVELTFENLLTGIDIPEGQVIGHTHFIIDRVK